MFRRILIANRGEIAVRIARACAKMGIISIGVYSDADTTALHVRTCDESYWIGPAPAAESYLLGNKIIEVARQAGADAIHPGYGFLSENAAFARAVSDAGLVWIGPPPEAIELMGSKIESKRLAEKIGVPTVPGYFGDVQSLETLTKQAQQVGYPVLIKASAGGGGKGMRVVERVEELPESLAGAQREAMGAFGDSAVLLEKYLTNPRHIEVQVLGDNFGNLIHLGERDCSIQRRHQKVFEESPCPIMTADLRAEMTTSSIALARASGYSNAGTVEFIYQDKQFYFLEMNTRLQVEHPVTEQALGIDLVEAQIRIAAGERLWISQDDVKFKAHAMEARLYAENPEQSFLPATGTITALHVPQGARVDKGVSLHDTMSPYYDPMIAKIIVDGPTRQVALKKMRNVLGDFQIEGLKTNLAFLRWLVEHPVFESGDYSTNFIQEHYRPGEATAVPSQVALAASAFTLIYPHEVYLSGNDLGAWHVSPWRQARQHLQADLLIEGQIYTGILSGVPGEDNLWQAAIRREGEIIYDGIVEYRLGDSDAREDGPVPTLQMRFDRQDTIYSVAFNQSDSRCHFYIKLEGRDYLIRVAPPISTETLDTSIHLANEDTLESPMPGKVLKMYASEGDQVAEGQPLVIIEAMKMEFTVRAPHDGKVVRLHYLEGAQVAVGDVLVELEK